MIVYGSLWSLWKARNNRVFNKQLISASKVMDDVISEVFFWLIHRGSFGNVNRSSWSSSPFAVQQIFASGYSCSHVCNSGVPNTTEWLNDVGSQENDTGHLPYLRPHLTAPQRRPKPPTTPPTCTTP
ncbi:hypothetical protein LXL04_030112 [Taraxacum kok-saghyz]